MMTLSSLILCARVFPTVAKVKQIHSKRKQTLQLFILVSVCFFLHFSAAFYLFRRKSNHFCVFGASCFLMFSPCGLLPEIIIFALLPLLIRWYQCAFFPLHVMSSV